MDKSKILDAVIQRCTNGNKAQFARMLGVEPNCVSSWFSRNSIPIDQVEKILTTFPIISSDFLVLGRGPVERGELPPPSEEMTAKEYFNNLKTFADKCGACAITNECDTLDGYHIVVKVSKIK